MALCCKQGDPAPPPAPYLGACVADAAPWGVCRGAPVVAGGGPPGGGTGRTWERGKGGGRPIHGRGGGRLGRS